ncbi:MAG: hypothetical protein HY761_00220 [Candidatus Omnitrophica bacterium]|nr:hypothetical protein [Candidatus Omnitrophota bacterium]
MLKLVLICGDEELLAADRLIDLAELRAGLLVLVSLLVDLDCDWIEVVVLLVVLAPELVVLVLEVVVLDPAAKETSLKQIVNKCVMIKAKERILMIDFFIYG